MNGRWETGMTSSADVTIIVGRQPLHAGHDLQGNNHAPNSLRTGHSNRGNRTPHSCSTRCRAVQNRQTAKVGGAGGFDYVYADEAGRRLYIPRTGNPARITVFNLDTLEPAGEIANTNARGAAVSPKSGHGFGSSKPVAMWDSKTLMPIKTIEVQGGPDGIMYDAFNDRVWVFSHIAPNATVVNAADGAVVGTVDLGGMPEQAASDGKGRLYVDLEDKNKIAVVDAKTLMKTGGYDLAGKGGTCAGLAMDVKNNILFATCRNPQVMVILSAADGKDHHHPADRHRHRWSRVQPQHHGSLQFARRRDSNDRQGKQPHEFRSGANPAGHDRRQDADLGQ
jgi:hypothetical protein